MLLNLHGLDETMYCFSEESDRYLKVKDYLHSCIKNSVARKFNYFNYNFQDFKNAKTTRRKSKRMATFESVPCQGRIKQTPSGKRRQCANQQLGRDKFWFQLRKP